MLFPVVICHVSLRRVILSGNGMGDTPHGDALLHDLARTWLARNEMERRPTPHLARTRAAASCGLGDDTNGSTTIAISSLYLDVTANGWSTEGRKFAAALLAPGRGGDPSIPVPRAMLLAWASVPAAPPSLPTGSDRDVAATTVMRAESIASPSATAVWHNTSLVIGSSPVRDMSGATVMPRQPTGRTIDDAIYISASDEDM